MACADGTVPRMDALPLVLSSGWAAGVNAYATVLLLGIFGRLGLGEVPDGLEDWWVIGAAAALYAVEFVTDKIPLRRPRLGRDPHRDPPDDRRGHRRAMNEQADGLHDALAAVGAGGTALASHAVKAGLRAAVNLSPDPVTTATASLTEDFLVGGRRGADRHPPVDRADRRGDPAPRRDPADPVALAGDQGAIRRFVSANSVIFLKAGPATVPP